MAAVLEHSPAADVAIRATVARLARELVTIDAGLTPVADAMTAAAATGKRIRPALVAWSHEAFGGRADDVTGAGVALELVHTSALVHDDVIDRADTRRGLPSVHAAFAARHADGWSGSAEDYGRSVAILLGDVLLAAAGAELLTCAVPATALGRAHAAFTRLCVEVMAGQFLDADAAARRDADLARALRIATLKSGRYSVARPLELGAVLAGVDDAVAAGLVAVGDPLGVAFQLGDDLLGVFGDPAATGKPAGADLIEGKRTVLVAETLARLDGARRARFAAGLGDARLDADGVDELRALIERSGARGAVEGRIRDTVEQAEAAIAALPLDAPRRAELVAFAAWLVDRRQ
jgi:geranylgeranyl diphosphate synthase, type I